MTQVELKRTPLYEAHVASKANLVNFHGWEMPVNYPVGILAEHKAVRSNVGVFDVSHMGELEFTGPQAEAFFERVFTNNVGKMEVGQARYGMLCDEEGTIIDDDIIYKGKDRWRMVVNAASIDTVFKWLKEQSTNFQVGIRNVSDQTTLLALQGPKSAEVIAQLAPTLLNREFRYYHFKEDVEVGGVPITIASRTGYTGENGMEFMSGAEEGKALWEIFMGMGIQPCGLGARNTLRIEAALPLGGNDISRELDGRGINPLEAGLEKFVDLSKDFIGSRRLREIAEAIRKGEWDRMLVGFVSINERDNPRDEMDIINDDGEKIGTVTSGTPSPTLGRGIGLGYTKPEYVQVGTRMQVDIRGRRADMQIVERPLYQGTAGRRMVAA